MWNPGVRGSFCSVPRRAGRRDRSTGVAPAIEPISRHARARGPYRAAAVLRHPDTRGASRGPRTGRGGVRGPGRRWALRRWRPAGRRGRWLHQHRGVLLADRRHHGGVAGRGAARAGVGRAGAAGPGAERAAGRRRPGLGLRTGLRVRAHHGQPRRHRRATARARPGRPVLRAHLHPDLSRARPAGRRRHRVRHPAGQAAPGPRAPQAAIPGPPTAPRPHRPPHDRLYCVRGREPGRDPC